MQARVRHARTLQGLIVGCVRKSVALSVSPERFMDVFDERVRLVQVVREAGLSR